MPSRKPPLAPPVPALGPDEIEQQFYEALRQADIDLLMAVWSDDDDIACVHPGGPRVIGAVAIRASFETMFAQGGIDIQAQQVRRAHSAGCSVHSVVEQVRADSPVGPQAAWVFATNVYAQTVAGWRLVAHHASPGSDDGSHEVAEPGAVLH